MDELSRFYVDTRFASSLDDLNRVIQLSDNFVLAYFMRAVVRFKQMNIELLPKISILKIANLLQKRLVYQKARHHRYYYPIHRQIKKESVGMDYEMVLRDYDKVIEMSRNSFTLIIIELM